MAIQFMDSFDHYGTGTDGGRAMLDGLYLNAGSESQPISGAAPVVPPFGARTGERCFRIEAFGGTRTGNGDGGQWRKAFPTPRDEVYVAFALYMETLPPLPQRYCCLGLRDADNNRIAELMVQTNGALQAVNGPFGDEGGTPNVIGETVGPVIAAGAWNHIEIHCVVSTGVYEVRLNEEPIITVSGASLGSADVAAAIAFSINMGFEETNMYHDDLVLSDATGSLNNTWNGDIRVATIYPAGDGAVSNWTAYPRQKIGEEILSMGESSGPLVKRNGTNGQADMDIGTGDYTIEGFVRFRELPGADDRAVLFAHWNEAVGNNRGWRLFKGGTNVEAGALVFEISTNGTAGGIVKVHDVEWEPRIGQWYHIAACRTSGVSRLFIDGVQRGADITDTNDYHLPTDDRADPTLGAQQGTSEFSGASGTIFRGFFDEVRWTVGVGRYTANFTPPTTAFPRDSGGDPDYDDTVFLTGFENVITSVITDESFADTDWQLHGNAAVLTPEDGEFKYQVVAETTPIDDNYVSADFLPAQAILRANFQPADADTVVIGPTTYTFRTTLSTGPTIPNEVLRGADRDASLANLVAAVNGATGEGTLYSTGTNPNPDATAEVTGEGEVTFTASTQGLSGNSITATESISGAAFDGSGFEGGADIPGPQDFAFGPLPALTTQVRAVQFTPRLSKFDAGSAQVQLSLRNESGDSLNGGTKTLTTAETYYTDIFETDPGTGGALTPTSIQTGLVRINRTT